MEFKICSSAFVDGGYLPSWYTSSRLNASPPFGWAGEPQGTKSLALICRSSEDGRVEWVLWNIPPDNKTVYGRLPAENRLAGGMRQGLNDYGQIGWTGPKREQSSDEKELDFVLYALDCVLDVPDGDVTAEAVERAMEGHVLDSAEMSCLYT